MEERRIAKDDDGMMRMMMDGPASGVEARGWRERWRLVEAEICNGSGKWGGPLMEPLTER